MKIFVLVVVVLFALALVALGNTLLMVILGALGHVFEVPKLYLSYWQSAVVYISLWVIGGFFRRRPSD